MNMYTPGTIFRNIIVKGEPAAIAKMKGNTDYPNLSGMVNFFATPYDGILVEAEIYGLPNWQEHGSSQFYAMHIHENGDCSGAFENTGAHYSRTVMLHPFHSGDVVPLLGNQGYAWGSFFDGRIMVSEIIGRSVIIHENSDDFTTQPSGNAGKKIGCGVIAALVIELKWNQSAAGAIAQIKEKKYVQSLEEYKAVYFQRSCRLFWYN